MAVHVMYRVTMVYRRGNDTVAVHVMYTYCQNYYGMQRYSDKVRIVILGQEQHEETVTYGTYIPWPSCVSIGLHEQLRHYMAMLDMSVYTVLHISVGVRKGLCAFL